MIQEYRLTMISDTVSHGAIPKHPYLRQSGSSLVVFYRWIQRRAETTRSLSSVRHYDPRHPLTLSCRSTLYLPSWQPISDSMRPRLCICSNGSVWRRSWSVHGRGLCARLVRLVFARGRSTRSDIDKDVNVKGCRRGIVCENARLR